MKKYIFFSDLDGTLLNKHHELSKKTIKYIRKLREQGHYFIINTGRPYQGTIKFVNELNIDCPFICDNGASIYWPNNKDFPIHTSITIDMVKQLLLEIKEYVYGIMLSSHQQLIFQEKNKIPYFIIHIDENTIVKEGIAHELVDTPILLISIYIHDEDRNSFLNILNKYKDVISYREWGAHLGIRSYELFSINTNKGNALKYLKEYFKNEESTIIAFGDDLNDIDMLQNADIGIALHNAKQRVIQHSKDVTEYSNRKDGVIRHIKKFMKKNGK